MLLKKHKPEKLDVRSEKLFEQLICKIPSKEHSLSIDLQTLIDCFIQLHDEYTYSKSSSRNPGVIEFIKKHDSGIRCLKSLRPSIDDFEMMKCVGKGHFGTVHAVKEKLTGNVYAMKVMAKDRTLKQGTTDCFMTERTIMGYADSKWIINLHYAFCDEKNLYFVMDYIPMGSLGDLLDYLPDNLMSESMAKFYLAEIAIAINVIHEMGYIHRDVKPENVLITSDGHIKLADFGTAASLADAKNDTIGMVGTPEYMAPEIFRSRFRVKPSVDYWSLGVTAYVVLIGDFPFIGADQNDVADKIINFKKNLSFDVDVPLSPEIISLMGALMSAEPERLNFVSLKQHQFFSSIPWENLDQMTPPELPSELGAQESEIEDTNSRSYVYQSRRTMDQDIPFIGFSFARPMQEAIIKKIRSDSLSELTDSKIPEDDAEFHKLLSQTRSENHKLTVSLSEMSMKSEEMKSLIAEKDQKISKYESSLSASKKELSDALGKITELDLLLSQQKNQSGDLKKVFEKYTEALRNQGAEDIDSLIIQHIKLKEDIKTLEEYRHSFKELTEKENGKYKESMNALEKNLEKEHNALKDQIKNNQDLQTVISSLEKKLTDLSAEYDKKSAALEKRISTMSAKINELESELNLIKIERDSLLVQVKDLTRIDLLAGSLDKANADVNLLKSEKSKLESSLQSSEEYIMKLKKEKDIYQQERDGLQLLVNGNQNTINVLTQTLESIQRILSNSQKDNEKKQEDVLSLKEKIKQTENRMQEIQKSHEEMSEKYSSLLSTKRWTESEVDQMKTMYSSEIKGLQKKIEKCEDQLNQLTSSLTEEKKLNTVLKHSSANLEEQLTNMTQTMKENEAKLKEKSDQCIETKAEMIKQVDALKLEKELNEHNLQRKINELTQTNRILFHYMSADEKYSKFLSSVQLSGIETPKNKVAATSSPSGKKIEPIHKSELSTLKSNVHSVETSPLSVTHGRNFTTMKRSGMRKTKESVRNVLEIYEKISSRPDKDETRTSKDEIVKHHNFVEEYTIRVGICPTCFNQISWGMKVSRCNDCKVCCHISCTRDIPYRCAITSKPFLVSQLSAMSSSYSQTSIQGSNINILLDYSTDKSRDPAILWTRKWMMWLESERMLSIYESANDATQNNGVQPTPLIQFDLSSPFTINPCVDLSTGNQLSSEGDENQQLCFSLEMMVDQSCEDLTDSQASCKSLYSVSSSKETQTIYLKAENLEEKRNWILTFSKCQANILPITTNSNLTPKLHTVMDMFTNDSFDMICTCVVNQDTMFLGCLEGIFLLDKATSDTKLCALSTEQNIGQIAYCCGYCIFTTENSSKLCLFECKSVLSDKKQTAKKLTKQYRDRLKTVNFESNILMMVAGQTVDGMMVVINTERSVSIVGHCFNEITVLWSIQLKDVSSMYIDESNERILLFTDTVKSISLKTHGVKDFFNNSTKTEEDVPQVDHPQSHFPTFISQICIGLSQSAVLVCSRNCLFLYDISGNRIPEFETIHFPSIPLQFVCKASNFYISFVNSIHLLRFNDFSTSFHVDIIKYDTLSHRLLGISCDSDNLLISLCTRNSFGMYEVEYLPKTVAATSKSQGNESLPTETMVTAGPPCPSTETKETKRNSFRKIFKTIIKK